MGRTSARTSIFTQRSCRDKPCGCRGHLGARITLHSIFYQFAMHAHAQHVSHQSRNRARPLTPRCPPPSCASSAGSPPSAAPDLTSNRCLARCLQACCRTPPAKKHERMTAAADAFSPPLLNQLTNVEGCAAQSRRQSRHNQFGVVKAMEGSGSLTRTSMPPLRFGRPREPSRSDNIARPGSQDSSSDLRRSAWSKAQTWDNS